MTRVAGSTLEIGMDVPHFTLKDQHGKDFRVEDYIGKQKLVIYFYPKDESAVCTKEACSFRDSFEEFAEAGVKVIGINSASVESHKSFAGRHNLPFTLLSDPGNTILKSFGIRNVLFLTGRETFIVDLSGKIVFKFRAFLNGEDHVKKTLTYLRNG